MPGAKALAASALYPLAVARELPRRARARARLALLGQRYRIVELFGESWQPQQGVKVLAVVTHVATAADLADDESRARKVEKLVRTIEGLCASFAHCDLAVVVNSIPGGHVVDSLPAWQRGRVELSEQEVADPMYAGFHAQEVFERRAEAADWFLYCEDDIVLDDPLLLEKLEFFSRHAGERSVLLPHLYELKEGRKYYPNFVDNRDWTSSGIWDRDSVLAIGRLRFAEFQNPHSGFYCLSRAQLADWLATGRYWYGRVSFVAPRESAATGCLFEAFRLYKPHPANFNFLEARHWDVKYAGLIEAARGG